MIVLEMKWEAFEKSKYALGVGLAAYKWAIELTLSLVVGRVRLTVGKQS
jgi:hypothetical protein